MDLPIGFYQIRIDNKFSECYDYSGLANANKKSFGVLLSRNEAQWMTGVKVTNLSEEVLDRICREIGDSFFDHEYGVRKDGMNEYGLRCCREVLQSCLLRMQSSTLSLPLKPYISGRG